MTRFTKQLKTYNLISSPHDSQSELQNLSYLPPSLIPLRDGEVIIFRRPDSPYWHCRFKRQNKWERFSTKQASIENAVQVACDAYDEARFRHKLGLARKAPNFTEIAHATLYELRRDLDARIFKCVGSTFFFCFNRTSSQNVAGRTPRSINMILCHIQFILSHCFQCCFKVNYGIIGSIFRQSSLGFCNCRNRVRSTKKTAMKNLRASIFYI